MGSFFDPQIFDTDIFDTALPPPPEVVVPPGKLHVGKMLGSDPLYTIANEIISYEQTARGQDRPNTVTVDGLEDSWTEFDRADLIVRDRAVNAYFDMPELSTLGAVRQRALEELEAGSSGISPGGQTVWMPYFTKMDKIHWIDEDGGRYETRIEGLSVEFSMGTEPYQRATIETGTMILCDPAEDEDGDYLARDLFDRDTDGALGTALIGGTWVTSLTPGAIVTPTPAFPKMMMWLPNWATMDNTAVTAVADDMVYMKMKGVVLKGMDWGSDYQLPSGVSAKLDIFIARGIAPFLDLHVGKLDIDDQTVAQQCIDAGAGKWAGIVCDAENQWVQHVKDPPDGVGATQARIDFDDFMDVVRPAVPLLAIAGYASPTSFPNFKYGWWNEEVDAIMPLAYFNDPNDTATGILNTMQNKFNQAHEIQGWTEPVKPIIPVVNGYDADLTDEKVAERAEYIDLAFERYGAFVLWRWIDDFPDNMREMLHGQEG